MLEEVTKRRILKAEEREENAPNAGEKILEDEHFFFFFFFEVEDEYFLPPFHCHKLWHNQYVYIQPANKGGKCFSASK